MKTACLIPYCPYPVNSGARSIFHKHIVFLSKLGSCSVLSSYKRPVGFGWTDDAFIKLRKLGFDVDLIDRSPWLSLPRAYGMLYAIFFKALKAERAFGHSNPYHRYAFDQEWFTSKINGCDLCEIHYSYWAYLKTHCPKVVIVHDLWSDIMWEGDKLESKELGTADLLVTVSQDDKVKLEKKGHSNVHWSPPCIESVDLDDSVNIGIVGSNNRHNVEGIDWLLDEKKVSFPERVKCFGGISERVVGDDRFDVLKRYNDALDPYRECGIVLMLTKGGTGLQIKGVEALASGRAIIARKGAMRGLPGDIKGWLEVETRDEMLEALNLIYKDATVRKRLCQQAKEYYMEYLEKNVILRQLKAEYQKLLV